MTSEQPPLGAPVLAELCGVEELAPPLVLTQESLFGKLVASFYERARARINVQCPEPASVRLEIGILPYQDFNAWACTYKGVDLIALHSGAIYILRDLFDYMLSNPVVLPQIGNPSSEVAQEYYNIETDTFIAIHSVRRFEPKDSARSDYAATLFQIGLNYIFQHELGHIFNGHTLWLTQTYGTRVLAEVGAASIPNIDLLHLQTLEVDADSFATLDCLSRFCGLTISGGVPQTRPSILGATREAIFSVLFALYCTWRIQAPEPVVTLPEVLQADHPPAAQRQRFIASLLLQFTVQHGAFNATDVTDIIKSVIIEAENIFAALTGKPIDSDLYSRTWDQTVELLQLLHQNWKNLRPQLVPLMRGGRFADLEPLR
jgi:hypothetical protein